MVALTLAIFVAPFVALVYSVAAGLAVMAAALGVSSFLLHDALAVIPRAWRRRLRVAIAVDLALAAACVVAIVWLLLER
jgi:hypothetical protein